MEIILVGLVLLFIIFYRKKQNESVYTFIVKSVGGVYEKYAPYSFKMVREKAIELGQEFTEEVRQAYLAAYKENVHYYSAGRKYVKGPIVELDEVSAIAILTKLQMQEELDIAVAEFSVALDKATAIADKHNLSFDLDTAYGMGGTYNGTEGVWEPSSQSC